MEINYSQLKVLLEYIFPVSIKNAQITLKM